MGTLAVSKQYHGYWVSPWVYGMKTNDEGQAKGMHDAQVKLLADDEHSDGAACETEDRA